MGILKEKISKKISNSPQIITQLKSIFEQDIPYDQKMEKECIDF